MARVPLPFAARVAALACAPFAPASTDIAQAFADNIDPFVTANCVKCHGDEKQKGDFRFDELSRDLNDPATAIYWMDVLDIVEIGDMPPEDAKDRPSNEALSAFTNTIRGALRAVAAAHNKLERPEIRRLSHSAMDHTVQDLTGVALPLSTDLPPDPLVAGFDNIAETMTISQEVMAQLQKNAHRVAQFALPADQNPTFAKTFADKDLGVGKAVFNLGDFRAAFSNKNLSHAFYPADFAAPFPGYYDVEVLGFAMDNREIIYPNGLPDPLPLARDKRPLRKRIPANKPRYVQIRALAVLPDGSIPQGSGAAPPPARTAGEFQIAPKAEIHRQRVWLDAGETFYLQYGSGIRQNNAPIVEYKGKQVPIGEAIYVRAIGIAGPVQIQWPLPLVELTQAPDASPEEKITALLTRTFRRPVDATTLSLYQALFDERYAQTNHETAAYRQVLEAALCSPRFLFNYDDGPANQSWATACRLSYFLWNSMPDGELFNLAATGDLVDPSIVGQQARRLLADPRAQRFVEDFTGQWLNTRHVGKMVPDAKRFPTYDKNLEDAIKTEPGAFFGEVLRRNLSVSEFIESDFAMLNERLADHYGIKGVSGSEFRSVKLPRKSPRGGILGQASVLTATSDGTRTSPVIRGIWVLENILGGHVSPPPADVKPLEPDVRGALSIREMLEKHRTVETCSDCHKKIDPLGFALENFDPIGSWRDSYVVRKTEDRPASRSPIDASGQLPDGTEIDDFASLQQVLLAKCDRFAATLTDKLFVHAMGRLPTIHEKHVLEDLLAAAAPQDYRLADLVVALCQSPAFLNAEASAPTDPVIAAISR